MTMNPMVHSRMQMLGAWSGIFYMIGVGVGWLLLAQFIPPHKPAASAEEIATILRADYPLIRVGMVLMMFGAMMAAPFAAMIGEYLSRIEGRAGVLTYSCIAGGVCTMVLTFYPAMWWLVACFRPERAAELLQLFNDMSWLQAVGGVSIFLPLPLTIAFAAFVDESPDPVFPRWAGYFNVWVVLAEVPNQLMFFFHSGPFAWNGLFGFWIPLTFLGAWFLVTFMLLRKAILKDRHKLRQHASLQ